MDNIQLIIGIQILLIIVVITLGIIKKNEFESFDPGTLANIYTSDKTNKFLVQESFSDKQAASNNLNSLCKIGNALLDHLEKKVKGTNSTDESRFNRLKSRFSCSIFQEGLPQPNADTTSFTQNKKEKMILCLRSGKNNKELHEMNEIIFVFIHELAHMMSVTYGHKKEFSDNFVYLLNNAVELGLYSPINYSKSPKEYCGITIDDSPLF